MTKHDRDRMHRAIECDLANRDSLADAVRGLQSTAAPELVPLHDFLIRRLNEFDKSAASGPPRVEDDAWREVVGDMLQRRHDHIPKYGTAVKPLDPGADWLTHQYEELLDAAVYAKAEILRRLNQSKEVAPWCIVAERVNVLARVYAAGTIETCSTIQKVCNQDLDPSGELFSQVRAAAYKLVADRAAERPS